MDQTSNPVLISILTLNVNVWNKCVSKTLYA